MTLYSNSRFNLPYKMSGASQMFNHSREKPSVGSKTTQLFLHKYPSMKLPKSFDRAAALAILLSLLRAEKENASVSSGWRRGAGHQKNPKEITVYQSGFNLHG